MLPSPSFPFNQSWDLSDPPQFLNSPDMENAYHDSNPSPSLNLIPNCNPNLNSDCNINPNANCNSPSTRALESLFDAFLNTNDLASPSGLVSFILEEVLRRQSSDAEKVALLRNSREFGLHLLNSANRLWRQHDTFSNSLVWPLSHDLSIKVYLCDVTKVSEISWLNGKAMMYYLQWNDATYVFPFPSKSLQDFTVSYNVLQKLSRLHG
mgnify:FL=1